MLPTPVSADKSGFKSHSSRLIPAWLILSAAPALYAVQLATGTEPLFAAYVLVFVLLTGAAVNAAGGLRSVSGLLIGLCAVKIVIVSQILKIWYGQPAHTNLEAPHTSMLVMVIAMLGMLSVAVAVRIVPLPRRGLLKPVDDPGTLLRMALIALTFALAAFAIDRAGEDQVGGIYGVVRLLLVPATNLTVVAATAHAILRSDRRRSLDVPAVVILTITVGVGLLSFSKRASLEPLLAYFVTCLAFRYRFGWLQFAAAATFLLLAIEIIAPVMNFVRDPSLSIARRAALIVETVENLLKEERILNEGDYWARDYAADVMLTPYYGEPKPFLDRYTPRQLDFAVHGAQQWGRLGWTTVEHGFKMLLPRFLYPDKPKHGSQSVIRQHIDRRGYQSETQFSFTLFADGYISFGYLGTYLFTVVLVGLLILEIKLLADRLTDNVWAVFLLLLFHHPFPEINASGYMISTTHGMAVTLAIILLVRWLARFHLNLLRGVRRPQGGRSLLRRPTV